MMDTEETAIVKVTGAESAKDDDDDNNVVKRPLEVVKCQCCELMEECTIAYIARVRERNEGWWICGLCGEAVKEEMKRSGWRISKEEALERHASFCEESRSPPEKQTEELISALKQLVIRSLVSPTSVRSKPSTPQGRDGSDLTRAKFVRSQSCFPSMDA
nr:PREDICTED: uncharacterized protein LOC108200217 [Daucus carota subsp. sativus]